MKVGDYVRYKNIITKVIKIDRIKKIVPPDEFIDKEYYEFSKGGTFKEYIIKSSPNIIGLIEAGDYVNGYLVEDISRTYYLSENKEITTLFLAKGSNYFLPAINDSKDIQSIVTKEQFEWMQYKVGE